ncbi:MAG TPA: winged helix DNA-binding domain-containing protein, partial [Nitrolancea sp.]|nr:winged helix DNA-binding domain-containing protein [Nitrolancea sp.]
QRLFNQHVDSEPWEHPVDIVRHLGAVQSQDFAAAKWALGLRLRKPDEDAIEHAFNDGAILRTHVLRPTWHFVTPTDIRWMLQLTSQRIIAGTSSYYRKHGLTEASFALGRRVFERTLRDRKYLSRTALVSELKQSGLQTDNNGYMLVLMRAELEGLICSGPRRGKQFTYALLEERVAPGTRFDRDHALAELCLRYFKSHGPATPHDFAWWSGLTVNDARRGIDMIHGQLEREEFDGKIYWSGAAMEPVAQTYRPVVLVPIYDETVIAYRDRSDYLHRLSTSGQPLQENIVFNHTIVVDGQIVGTWKRTLARGEVTVEMHLFASLSPTEERDVAAAVERYASFVDRSTTHR